MGAALLCAGARDGHAQDEGDAGNSTFWRPVFVPDISLIVDMSGVYRSAGRAYTSFKIPGFGAVADGHGHEAMNSKPGFNFNYAELSLRAAVDPYFSLVGIFHGSPDGFEVEEGYFSSTSIPFGFGVRAGKFLSGIGRMNSQHHHAWDFATQPLVYEAMFGAHGLNEIGGQVSWVAPLPFFLKLGAEALQGENEAAYGADGFHDPSYRYRVSGSNGPNAYTGFVKWGFDIGPLSFLQGGWGAHGINRSYHQAGDIDYTTVDIFELTTAAHGRRARSWTAGAECTVKWPFDSHRYLALQAEYIYRDVKGYHYHVSLDEPETTDRTLLREKQSGLYCQAVVKPLRWWRIGFRYDLLNLNRVRLSPEAARVLLYLGGFGTFEPAEWAGERAIILRNPSQAFRLTAMTDFNPSEFTMFRAQYAYDPSRMDRFRRRRTNHEVIVQANLFIGTHGAHPF